MNSVTTTTAPRHPIIEVETLLYEAKIHGDLVSVFQRVQALLREELYEERVYKRIQKKCTLLFHEEMGADWSLKRVMQRIIIACEALFFAGPNPIKEFQRLQELLEGKMAEARYGKASAFLEVEKFVEGHLISYSNGTITKKTENRARLPLIDTFEEGRLSRREAEQKMVDSYFRYAAQTLNRLFIRQNGGAVELINPTMKDAKTAPALALYCKELIHAVRIDFRDLRLSQDEIRRKAYETMQEVYDEEIEERRRYEEVCIKGMFIKKARAEEDKRKGLKLGGIKIKKRGDALERT